MSQKHTTADGVELVAGMTVYAYRRMENGTPVDTFRIGYEVIVGESEKPVWTWAPVVRGQVGRPAVLGDYIPGDVFADRAAYDADQAQRAAARAEYGRQRREAREKRAASARRYEAMCDRLYAEAMSLAVDTDDMDVVEHHCQGHADRLRTFIESRRATAALASGSCGMTITGER